MRTFIIVATSVSLLACASSPPQEPPRDAAPETEADILGRTAALAYELDAALAAGGDGADCDQSAAVLEGFRAKNIERLRALKPKMAAIETDTVMQFLIDQGAPMVAAQERVARIHGACSDNARFYAAFMALDDRNIE